ncbi:Golgi transport complex subunit 5-domain-containing protein, partial [Blyttiomyces helicus]
MLSQKPPPLSVSIRRSSSTPFSALPPALPAKDADSRPLVSTEDDIGVNPVDTLLAQPGVLEEGCKGEGGWAGKGRSRSRRSGRQHVGAQKVSSRNSVRCFLTGSSPSRTTPPEYKEFAILEQFDPQQYANSIIQPTSQSFSGGDVSTALAKLSFAIDHLNAYIKLQVTTHYEDLLHQVTGLSHLESFLQNVKDGIDSLNSSFERVRAKIRDPYLAIQACTLQLDRIQAASEVLRRVMRFLYLVRRLDTQLPGGEKDLPKAALSINELESILQESDLSGIEVVDAEIQTIADAKRQIAAEAEKLLDVGMSTQNQTDVAAGLQVFHNLGQMASTTQARVDGMLETIARETHVALDVASLNKEVKGKSNAAPSQGGVRRVNEPTTAQQNAIVWASLLWTRIERLMDVMYENAVKVYLLEKVLARKRDLVTHVPFLDEVVKNMDGNIVSYFSRILAHSFERELRLATKSSSFLQQVLQNGYPKLLRLFHDYFSRVAGISGEPGRRSDSPESALLLRTIASFETAYLSRSLSRLLDPINVAFAFKAGPGARTLPLKDDIDKLIRVITSEVEVAKFDSNLLKRVAKNVAKALDMYAVKAEQISATDSNAYQVTGSGTATQSQLLNIEIANCLWWLQESAWKALEEHVESGEFDAVNEALENMSRLLQGIVEPLLTAMTRELETAILHIHREENYIRQYTPGSRGSPTRPPPPESGTSTYVLELASKIRWMQRELLSRFQ